MGKPTRRDVLRVSGAVGFTAASARRILGANDRIRLGIIGTGNRGTYFIREVQNVGGAEWVAVCDIYGDRRDRAATVAGSQAAAYDDYRRVLERTDIDAVNISTPDHHHAQMTIEACRAGKDVYVEKPMTTAPEQGLEVVRVVRDTRRVVQVGTQQRSMPHLIEAKQRFIDSGLIGQVHAVRTHYESAQNGYCIPVPPGMERKPDNLDWEAWLGPLPKIPWDPKRYFNRFAYWDVSCGGMIGGLFIHMVDEAHWYLGLHNPIAAVAEGGIYKYDDGRDTPDHVHAIVAYPEKVMVTFGATLTDTLPVRKYVWPEVTDVLFIGTGGRLSAFRNGYKFTPGEQQSDQPQVLVPAKREESPHVKNWLDCARGRRHPNANVVDGHYSAMACHMANMAYRRKTRIEWSSQWALDSNILPDPV
jgi:predicted dehydrogenase